MPISKPDVPFAGSNMWAQQVTKPKCLQQLQFRFQDKLLMIPGPTNIDPRVLDALSMPILSHTDAQFYKLLREVQDGIRYVFQTENKYTFAITGSATSAMEMAISNVLSPEDTFVSLVHGHWGDRAASMAEKIGAKVFRLHTPSYEHVFDLHQIEYALKLYQPKMLYVCHGDSSLGLVQPLDGIGEVCHRYNCLLLVDAVVSLCTTQLNMDVSQIDILYSGAQKALSGPPGIAPISFSDRAIDVIRRRRSPITTYYSDIWLVARSWGIDNNGVYKYHYTHAINLLYGLHRALALVVEEGLENVVQRHQSVKIYFEQLFESNESGLKFLIQNPQNRLPGIMSVIIPEDLNGGAMIKHLYEKYHILIGGSLLAKNVVDIPNFWRIGYLGVNADKTKVRKLIHLLHDSIRHFRNLKSRL